MFQRMRTKGIFIAIALVGFVASALADGGGYMKADEVTALMSGNSISGMFGDNKAYRQRNHSNGIAVVAVKGDPVRLIPWFVDEKARYCEDWSEWGVFCFKFKRTDKPDTIISERENGKQMNLTWREGYIDINHK
ncbi:hypothetical protein [uncultured Kiloniella sp.]|uniref:hypothetical protein n=1 Tax=uncultured Kiloniella sp. TaxID=1133091 RepID=UPI00260B87C6|nr:hypothetical protein [uncultured Kiloniella sp.]